jgi:hypothetical protein
MTDWSIITNRNDTGLFWTEWRTPLVSIGGTAAAAGAIPMLNANGQIDPSMVVGGGGGSGYGYGGGGYDGGGLSIEVAGVAVANQTTLNFIAGSNVTITSNSNGGILISSGGGGGGNSVQVLVDFGSDTGPITKQYDATVTVSASWVTSSTILVCSLAGVSTAQHSPEDGLIEGLLVQPESIVAGTGFTVRAYSPLGSYGQYAVNVVGL